MIYVDFPFSLVLVARGWRNDNFSVLVRHPGYLWWYLLRRAADPILSK